MIGRLSDLRARARERPPGYLKDFLKVGTIRGDLIEIPDAEFARLCVKWQPRGLGDRIAKVAKPIAKGIDSVLGTNLENCGGCEQRQDYLNEKFPAKP